MSGAGLVSVILNPFVTMNIELRSQAGTCLLDDPAVDDGFGSALAVGDFDRDGYDDLAVGVPGEDVDYVTLEEDAGAVNVLYGEAHGLSCERSQFWTQNSGAESGDRFGHALTAGDLLHRDGRDDLAIGAPYDEANVGSVTLVLGCDSGLCPVYYGGTGFISQDTEGVSGIAEDGDGFGFALVAIAPVKYEVFLPLVVRGYP